MKMTMSFYKNSASSASKVPFSPLLPALVLIQVPSEMQMSSNMPTFGGCQDLTSHVQYLQEVDNADPRVNVLVHLYEPSIRSCVALNRYLEDIAAKHPTCKFLRMKASASGIHIDRVAFPMLTLYRAGETVQVFAGLEEELGERFTCEDVEWLLESSGVFT